MLNFTSFFSISRKKKRLFTISWNFFLFSQGYAGCVHFQQTDKDKKCDIKVMILLYNQEKNTYLGFIPNDQLQFVDCIRKVIQQQKEQQRAATGSMMQQQQQQQQQLQQQVRS